MDYDIVWKSTPAERYQEGPDSMIERALRVVSSRTGLAVEEIPTFGGSDSAEADNGLTVQGRSLEDAHRILNDVGAAVGKRAWLTNSRTNEYLVYFDPTDRGRRCPDSGACHHGCTVGCWRVANAGPLSIAQYPDDLWPDEVKAAYAENDGSL